MKKYSVVLVIICFCVSSCAIKKPIRTEDELKYNNNVFEYGDLIKLSSIFDNNDITFEKDYLDIDFLGKKDIDINYIKDNISYVESFSYEVKDTTSPIIYIGDTYSVNVDYDGTIEEKIICADNYDKNPNCYIEGDYDFSKAGKYKLTYIAIDENNNKTENPFTLTVKKPNNNSNNNVTIVNEKTLIEDIIAKYKTDETMIGIDVSKYQGIIDWQKVKESGVEFAMIRLGTQTYFNEENILDEHFKDNIEGAIANGIEVGIYFYSYATTIKEAEEQAMFVIDSISNYNVTFPIAFDWENFKHFNELSLSLYDLRALTIAFQDKIKEYGYTPISYGSKNYLTTFWYPFKYETWLAHYKIEKSTYEYDYKMWQICNDGKVNGINGDVDIDIYYK